ncbi:hypothetical protein HAX54_012185 [Datura stramonium]|uniref:Uncharacterized protein n=1 Tax=Datura stramonium TaxID=4076 RepID=A0ABS8Y2C8_DATST|nr:hypothetical protein [Datura stramonium]
MGSCGNGNRFEMENDWEFWGPDPSEVTEDCWAVAEEAIKEVVNCVHPTLDTEEKRKDVIDYVQRLIRCSLGCEVFPYGSVPLKTYLPDGDIDLTVFGSAIIEDTLARDVLAVLQEEELKENAEYDVKDPQFIDAEVKLVKCIVQNTVIDISINQLGGLCTLCFLEQVDRLVGKNHLFKRSIILIKAWCYYESRLLGAHHGLISTYALETLVLFIFQLFHSSLNGPLAVLYRFLDFYRKFDWDNYCISLNGPVCKSSLPEIFVEMPDYISNELLLSEEFLRNSMEMFSVPSRGLETDTRAFQQKYLNIIDPLKENNNLGRSVSRGNLYRIQRAFKYGARKLGDVLLSPSDKVADKIKKFFANTIERHRLNHVIDLQYSSLIFSDEDTLSPAEFYANAKMLLKSSDGDFENDNLKKAYKSISNELLSNLMNGVSSDMVSEYGSFSDDAAVSGFCLYRDANDPSASVPLNLNVANGTYDYCSNGNSMSSLSWKHYYAPPFHFNRSCVENENCGPENLCRQSDLSDSGLWVETTECPQESSSFYQAGTDYSEDVWSGSSAISSPKTSILESLTLDIGERDLASTAGDIEAMNPLVDLSGDYDSHIRSLLYGQCCYGFALSVPVLNNPSSSPPSQNKNFWDTVRQSIPLRQNSFWQTNWNGMLVEPAAQPSGNALPSTATLGFEEREMAQGIGTYFLNKEHHQERRYKGWTRSKAPGSHGQLHLHSGTHSNECIAFSDANHSEKCTEEISAVKSSVQGREKLAVPSQSDNLLEDSHVNAFSNSSCVIEFGSLGNLSEDVLSPTSRDVLLIPSVPQKVQLSEPACSEQGRAAENSLHLKNEDEFPPLPLWKV